MEWRCRQSDVHTEITIYARAFYNTAWRLCEMCGRRTLPGLEDVKPRGITRVRNELILHPERTTRLFEPSFGMAVGGTGPMLKTNRPPDSKAHVDRGLYANAEEFREGLANAIGQVLRTEAE